MQLRRAAQGYSASRDTVLAQEGEELEGHKKGIINDKRKAGEKRKERMEESRRKEKERRGSSAGCG